MCEHQTHTHKKHECSGKASSESKPDGMSCYTADDPGEFQIPHNMKQDDACDRQSSCDVNRYNALAVGQCLCLSCAPWIRRSSHAALRPWLTGGHRSTRAAH